MRRARIALLASAALFAWAPTAWAKADTRDGELIGSGSGQVTLTWHGAPARGGAAAGVCDVSGSLTFQPDEIDINGAFRPDGRFYPADALFFSIDPAVVRVRRQPASGPASICLDLVDVDGLALAPTELPGGRYSFSVSTAGSFAQGFSAGRCMGPTAAELKAVFPSGVLGPPTRGHRSRSFDLTGSRDIAAGPFSGRLESTVTARLAPELENGSDSEPDSLVRGGTRTIRIAAIEYEYRVAGISGSLTTTFAGTADPFCRPFDSCGAQGTGTYTPSNIGSSGRAAIVGWRQVGLHERVTRRSEIRELHAGQLRVEGDLFGPEGALAKVAATVRHADGSTCTDPGETLPLGVFEIGGSRKSAHFVLDPPDYSSVDALRTWCQGPSESDVLGSNGSLAAGTVPVTSFGSRSLRVPIVPHGSFKTSGYSGNRTGELDLNLQLTRTRFLVRRFRVSRGEEIG
jgi:hypothetical protein